MEVFERPADMYVAGFIGAPSMNFLRGVLEQDGRAVRLAAGPFVPLPGRYAGNEVMLGIRPEHLTLGTEGLTVTVDLIEPLGSETLVHGRVAGSDETIVVKAAGVIVPSETIMVAVQSQHVHLFDAASGRRVDAVG
jgi:sn-glycerol 3-phosphate transport system ATP-binding protein